jgi:hypothetical protein
MQFDLKRVLFLRKCPGKLTLKTKSALKYCY